MILFKVKSPVKAKEYVAHKLPCLYQTDFDPQREYEENNMATLRDWIYGVWGYKPPWAYKGVTDFTPYENIVFGEGMSMRVEKKDGERYSGAWMSTMRQSGRCKAWGFTRWEADMELPSDPNVVAAFWGLTKTHELDEPIWSYHFNRYEKDRITPEFDWPETSTERIRDKGKKKFNIANHYGLSHYKPYKRHKDRQFPVVKGRHIWWVERHPWGMLYGLDGSICYVQIGGVIDKKMYPIFWITVPEWAPLGFDPKGCNMKVYSFKVFENPELKTHLKW